MAAAGKGQEEVKMMAIQGDAPRLAALVLAGSLPMNTQSTVRKIFEGVADRRQMFRLFDRHAHRPTRGNDCATELYAGEWFEITEVDHDYMFDILPPLWMRGGMFALREFLTDSITSVFFTLWISGRLRYFHGYCDLSDRLSPDHMRTAILEHETRPDRKMTREECLEHIWSETNDAYRGYAGDGWSEEARGRRFVVVYGRRSGAATRLLEDLTLSEIAAKLPGRLLPDGDLAAA